jgi:hypothetical protein
VYYVVARGTKPWLVRAAEGKPCRRGSAQTTRGKPHSRACQAAYLIYNPNPGTGNALDSRSIELKTINCTVLFQCIV